MSDPTEASQVNPHPATSHRTPRELAKDEVAPTGPKPAETPPPPPDLKKSDKERQAAVQRSAHVPKK